jgi:hypothetical protein
MLYERLNPEMREMVDAYAERLRELPWPRRSDALTEAARPFGERFGPEQARLAGQGFVTAVLERLPEDEVVDAHQAVLFRLSLNPAHQAAAEAWLVHHPEVRQLVDAELAGED